MHTGKNAQIKDRVQIQFLKVETSIGKYRRDHVYPVLRAQASSYGPVLIDWNLDYVQQKSVSLTQRSTLVSDVPCLAASKDKTVSDVTISFEQIAGCFNTFGKHICSVCGTCVLDPLNTLVDQLNLIEVNSIVMLAIPTEDQLKGAEISIADLAELYSIERVIVDKHKLVLAADLKNSKLNGLELLVMDSAVVASLQNDTERLKHWLGLVDQFNGATLLYTESKDTVSELCQLYPSLYCNQCKVVLDRNDTDSKLGTYKKSKLGELKLSDALTILGNIDLRLENNQSRIVRSFCALGFGDIPLNTKISTLNRSQQTLLKTLCVAFEISSGEIYIEDSSRYSWATSNVFQEQLEVFGVNESLIFYDSEINERSIEDESNDALRKFDCIGTVTGILKKAAPLFAATNHARRQGLKLKAFALGESTYLCDRCSGAGIILNGTVLPGTCEVCCGNKVQDNLGEVYYNTTSYFSFLKCPIRDLIEKFAGERSLSRALRLLVVLGFGELSLSESWLMLDSGELKRAKYARTIITSKTTEEISIHSDLFGGLSRQEAQKAVDFLGRWSR